MWKAFRSCAGGWVTATLPYRIFGMRARSTDLRASLGGIGQHVRQEKCSKPVLIILLTWVVKLPHGEQYTPSFFSASLTSFSDMGTLVPSGCRIFTCVVGS